MIIWRALASLTMTLHCFKSKLLGWGQHRAFPENRVTSCMNCYLHVQHFLAIHPEINYARNLHGGPTLQARLHSQYQQLVTHPRQAYFIHAMSQDFLGSQNR